ncbi:MAG TPA: AbrB/MazE/SpoVT family DNA-binding domain-containing protein [Terriglobales bacterium]|nr:AbrB/MazE/SpoVT family DNA-binding domain-containing protein [Terriglobales bacterium]
MAKTLRVAAKVTSKGQITLPLALRRELGIRTGDRVRFESEHGHVRLRVERGESPFLAYQGIGNPGIRSGRPSAVAWVRRLRQP